MPSRADPAGSRNAAAFRTAHPNGPNRHGWMILRGRLEGEPGDVFLPADVRGQDQVEVEVDVVDGLLAL